MVLMVILFTGCDVEKIEERYLIMRHKAHSGIGGVLSKTIGIPSSSSLFGLGSIALFFSLVLLLLLILFHFLCYFSFFFSFFFFFLSFFSLSVKKTSIHASTQPTIVEGRLKGVG